MNWYTSDQHFGHFNIMKYCKRPFENVDKMTNELVKRYNSVIGENDTVYHLGDLTMSRDYNVLTRVIERLNGGRKILILGNHDYLRPHKYLEMGFESVHTSLEIEDFVLVHDPVASIVDEKRKFLCGHVHNMFKRNKNVINVGVDVWDFFPVSHENLLNLFAIEGIL